MLELTYIPRQLSAWITSDGDLGIGGTVKDVQGKLYYISAKLPIQTIVCCGSNGELFGGYVLEFFCMNLDTKEVVHEPFILRREEQ